MITFSHLGQLGRLGNQMFQYAALRGLALEKGYESKIPDPLGREWHGQKCLLGELNIESAYLEAEDLQRIKFRYQEPNHMTFDPNFYSLPDNCDLVGFFQSTYYFEKHQEQIKKELTPNEEHLFKAKKRFDKIKKDNSDYQIVSLHIRRGDNTDNTDPNQVALREFFNKGASFDLYLKKAMDIFSGTKVKYLVFTGGKRWNQENEDDIRWCKDRLGDGAFIYAEGGSSIEDFSLIMQCDHHILSHVSSFGWWAAYLADKKGKIIVAPLKYHPDCLDINYRPGFYPNNWRLV